MRVLDLVTYRLNKEAAVDVLVRLAERGLAHLADVTVHRGEALAELSEELYYIGLQEALNLRQGVLQVLESAELDLRVLVAK